MLSLQAKYIFDIWILKFGISFGFSAPADPPVDGRASDFEFRFVLVVLTAYCLVLSYQ
jgi:hypothetical protein